MKRRHMGSWGFTLVEMMIVIGLLGLLISISVANSVKVRLSSQKNGCIVNLKQIDGAKAVWRLEEKKGATDTPTEADIIGLNRYIREKPVCPGGGVYTFENTVTKARCSVAAHTW